MVGDEGDKGDEQSLPSALWDSWTPAYIREISSDERYAASWPLTLRPKLHRQLADERMLVPTWNNPETSAELAWMAAVSRAALVSTPTVVRSRP